VICIHEPTFEMKTPVRKIRNVGDARAGRRPIV
jgi:hypothetical protein